MEASSVSAWVKGCERWRKPQSQFADSIHPLQVSVHFRSQGKSNHDKMLNAFRNMDGVRSVILENSYGFIKTTSPAATKKILETQTTKPGTIWHKCSVNFLPYYEKSVQLVHEDYKPVVIDECGYEAENPSEPSLHSLNDDVLLHIIKFLDFSEIIKLERVCKRLFHLSRLAFCEKIKPDLDEENTLSTLFGNGLRTIESQFKGLMILGKYVKNMLLPTATDVSQYKWFERRLLNVIGEYCHGLESFHVRGDWNIRRVLKSNPAITKLTSAVDSVYCSQHHPLCSSVELLQNLKTVVIDTCDCIIYYDEDFVFCGHTAPSCEELDFSLYASETLLVERAIKHFPNLKSIALNLQGTPQKEFEAFLEPYPNLETLSIEGVTLEEDLKSYPTIKKFFCYARSYPGNITEKFPALEELLILLFEDDTPKFHLCRNLKKLSLFSFGTINTEKCVDSLKQCKHLEHIFWRLCQLSDVLRVVESLPRLKYLEIELPRSFIDADALDQLVKATRKRTTKLGLCLARCYLTEELEKKIEGSNIYPIGDWARLPRTPYCSYTFDNYLIGASRQRSQNEDNMLVADIDLLDHDDSMESDYYDEGDDFPDELIAGELDDSLEYLDHFMDFDGESGSEYLDDVIDFDGEIDPDVYEFL